MSKTNGNGAATAAIEIGEPTTSAKSREKASAKTKKGAKEKAASAVTSKTAAIVLPKINIERMKLTLVGDSPLIVHKFSEKAKRQIKDKQAKKAHKAREARDPEADYNGARYLTKDGKDAFPAIGLKQACINAARYVDGVTLVFLRGAIHVMGDDDSGDLVRIRGCKPELREDMVRIDKGGTSDIRYRPEYRGWSMEFTIRYNAAAMTPEQIVSLFQLAGFHVGLGEWRPEKGGQFGMFHVQV